MMHKRLLVVFGIIAAVVLLVVLGYVTFAVGDVNVNATNNIVLSEQDKADIVKLSGIKSGNNVFAIDENIAIQNIEKNYPTIKVLSIERKFPNNVYIYVSDRVEVFSLKIAENRYAFLDRELKVIEIATQNNPEYTQLTGVAIDNLEVGEVLKNSDSLLKMIKGAERCSFINARFYSFIKKVEVFETEIWLSTNTGVVICLPISSNIEDSMINSYGYYLKNTSEVGKSQGKIILTNDGWIWQEN